MKINQDVIDVLANSNVEGNKLFLPDSQLERKLYVLVNKALTALGGKWNRSAKAHLFKECPELFIEQLIETGEYIDTKKLYQFFETPTSLAERVIELACIEEDDSVCEPSAGKGRIASLLDNVDVIELEEGNRKYLLENNYNLIHDDFMTFDESYDVFVANPPFSKQQDIDHVTHMISLSNKTVVSIMSASVLFRDNKKTVEFRELVESFGGEFIELDVGIFKDSGTMVKSVIVKVTK